ncbi:DNA methyltransferase [Aggregatibacter actinomycetemcomitans]|uniref:DNA methyltransferase n=1 Tax=Aggregatibacter actinomycetemcomitans TaxID=714 RepID=UPI000D691410|nr:DNA methyltransferase [Aggregatibacter actinomycetemcomitans]
MIRIYHGDATEIKVPSVDMIFTDPPFEMSGKQLKDILDKFNYQHLLLICSMHQALEFYKITDLDFSFDLVVSHITPKKSKNYSMPNMLHSNILYFKKPGIKSAFDRRRVQRNDVYSDENNYYFPSIFHAPKTAMTYKYQKNQNMINDLIGGFDVKSVLDPFSGSGTTAYACSEHGIDAYCIEQDKSAFEIMKNNLRMLLIYNDLEINE